MTSRENFPRSIIPKINENYIYLILKYTVVHGRYVSRVVLLMVRTKSRYVSEFLHNGTIFDRTGFVGSNLPRGEVLARPDCALWPRGRRLRGGVQ